MGLSPLRLRLARSVQQGRAHRIEDEPNTRAQRKWIWLRVPQKRQLWRAANQVGKSRALAKRIIHFVRGSGPYKDRPRRRVRVLVISISKEQMEPLHEKIWELLPKDEIAPTVEYEPGFGFRGKPPRIPFVAGPGRGSVITFATYSQGSRRMAGGTYDVVALDEPVPERVWGEIQPRVLHGNPGEIWVTFTPTPDSPPLDYLRELVEKQQVYEMQTSLTVEAVKLEGTNRALLTQDQISRYSGDLLEIEKDMRLHGGWEVVVKDRLLTNWGPACVRPSAPVPGCILAVGMDHGAGAGKQAAALLAISQANELTPHVWVLEESVADGFTTPDQDAAAVLEMLGRRGWTYDDVDIWVGDRASGMNRYDVRKSNRDIQVQMARILKRRPEQLKRIEVPHKWSGSVTYGFRLLNAIMGRRETDTGESHFLAAPHLKKFADAAQRWRGQSRDPLKDILDAVRYPVEKVVKPGVWFSFKVNYA